jgi:hypothetical protein
MLRISEIGILRNICGPIKESNIWRLRYNNELYQSYNGPDIMKVIKSRRFRWLGHLFGMQE